MSNITKNNESIAKYCAMSVAAVSQALGHPVDNKRLKKIYESLLSDLEKLEAFEITVDAFDKLIRR